MKLKFLMEDIGGHHSLIHKNKNHAIFENFNPIIWVQLYVYNSLLNFFWDPPLKRFSGNKPYKLTQNGPTTSDLAPFWSNMGQILRPVPGKPLE